MKKDYIDYKDYQACERYQSLSKKDNGKKLKYGCEWYKYLSEDEKQKLTEYRKKYYEMRKNTTL